MDYDRCYARRTTTLLQISYFIIIIILLAGCNLASEPSDTAITDTPQPIITIHPENATEIACQLQENWYKYTIQRGDNLTRIANITNSSVDELITANCLESPNRIRVGQTIYVPNEPD